MRHFTSLFSTVFFLLFSVFPEGQSAFKEDNPGLTVQNLRYEDYNYTKETGGIMLYGQDPLQPPVIPLGGRERLTLEFDLYGDNADYLRARLFHCTANWGKSRLRDLQFLEGFNELVITDYEFSESTLQPYVHFSFTLPATKVSGNFVIGVYREDEPDKMLFTRRFMVYENRVNIEAEIVLPNRTDRRMNSQEIALTIAHGGLVTNNPQQEIMATIRQNYRWDTAVKNMKANNYLIGERKLEFRTFTNELTFYGGNEFRFIDLRSRSIPGINVAKIEPQDRRLRAITQVFQYNRSSVYTSTPINMTDLNGAFVYGTLEPGADALEIDYVQTDFLADLGGKQPYPVYLVGAFNHYRKNKRNEMKYEPATGLYRVNHLLKQGVYAFTIESDNQETDFPLDGTFRLTENVYDVLVYQREISRNYDRLVGYSQLKSDRH